MGTTTTTAANIKPGDTLIIALDIPVKVAAIQHAGGKIHVTLTTRQGTTNGPGLSYHPDQTVTILA